MISWERQRPAGEFANTPPGRGRSQVVLLKLEVNARAVGL
jgi:hypothetical protein